MLCLILDSIETYLNVSVRTKSQNLNPKLDHVIKIRARATYKTIPESATKAKFIRLLKV